MGKNTERGTTVSYSEAAADGHMSKAKVANVAREIDEAVESLTRMRASLVSSTDGATAN